MKQKFSLLLAVTFFLFILSGFITKDSKEVTLSANYILAPAEDEFNGSWTVSYYANKEADLTHELQGYVIEINSGQVSVNDKHSSKGGFVGSREMVVFEFESDSP